MASSASRDHAISIITDFTPSPAEKCCENPSLIETGRGEIVCKNCGLVHEREIKSQSRTAYNSDEVRARLSNAPMIGRNSSQILISRSGRYAVKDLESWVRMTRVDARKNDRLRQSYYNAVRIDCKMLDMPWHITETAVRIFSQCLKDGNLRGRCVTGMSRASIYYACIVNNFPISLKVLWNGVITQSRAMSFLKLAKQAADALYGRKIGSKKERQSRRVSMFCDMIDRMANDVGIDSMQCKNITKEIYFKIILEKEGKVFIGKNPATIIASLLFIVAKMTGIWITVADQDGNRVNRYATQKLISKGVNITEVSLRSRSKEIASVAKEIKKRTGKSVHPVIDEFAEKYRSHPPHIISRVQEVPQQNQQQYLRS